MMMMGRFLLALACVIACVAASSASAGGINPMRWPKDQWRSDLFDSYPLRPHHHRVRIVKHVVLLKIDRPRPQPASAAQPLRPPLVIRNGQPLARRLHNGSVASHTADRCTGVLVLTWDGQRARRDCR